MAFANNGAAIIKGVMVPAAEVIVLRTLVELGKPATVPEVASHMNDKMSDASLYSLLGRLADRRGLVSREAVVVEVHGTRLRRVVWTADQAVTSFFAEMESGIEAKPQKSPPPAGATRQPVEEAGSA